MRYHIYHFRHARRLQGVVSFLLALIFSQMGMMVSAQDKKNVIVLEPNKPIERELAKGQSDSYRITISADQFVRFIVDQRGIDVLLVLVGADGREIMERDRPNGRNGEESLSFIAMTGGDYRLDVRAVGETTAVGRYEIKTYPPRAATDQDRKRIQAETLFQDALRLGQVEVSESVRQACDKYEVTVELFREIGDKYAEALSQTSLGYGRGSLGETEKALAAHDKALSLYLELKDRPNQAMSLAALCVLNALLQKVDLAIAQYHQAKNIYRELTDTEGEKRLLESLDNVAARYLTAAYRLFQKQEAGASREALTLLPIARDLFSALDNKSSEGVTLTALGLVNKSLGETQKALDYYRQALPLNIQAGDKRGEATTLNNIGAAYDLLGNRVQALDSYNQALRLYETADDKRGQATTFNNVGALYDSLGERQKALDYFDRALRLYEILEDQSGQAAIHNHIAVVYDSLGEVQKALDAYDRALSLSRMSGDKREEAIALNNGGLLFNALGEWQKALDYCNRALTLFKAIGDKSGETSALTNRGTVYDTLGDKQTALDQHTQALSARRALGDRRGEASSLNQIGLVYESLGEKQEALDYFNKALLITRSIGDRANEAASLSNIGGVYDSLGESQKALDYFNRALPITREVGVRSSEAATLNNIGAVYKSLGQKQKALDYYNQALTLVRELKYKRGEAATLSNIGGVYDLMGDEQKALDSYEKALPLMKALGDKQGEATVLSGNMMAWYVLSNPRLAVFYGKQSINSIQAVRSRIQTTDKDLQKSFLKSVEYLYRFLSGLLIEQGRFAEAQQILNAFKDQQYFDFNPETVRSPGPLAMTQREARMASRYDLTSEKIGNIGTKIEELQRRTNNANAKPEDTATLRQLQVDLKDATNEFSSLVKQAQTEFKELSDPVEDKPPDVKDAREMQVALQQITKETGQEAVAIYTIVGETKLQALIVSGDNVSSASTAIKGTELSRKAQELWLLLCSPDYDPKILSREVYEAVFKPIAEKLPKETKTIIWALDGKLRYLPMAALYDGKQYLVERYNHVLFTRADRERLTRGVSATWNGYVFATSESHKFELYGKPIEFPASDFAENELQIFRTNLNPNGIIDADIYSEQQFSKSSLRTTLKQERPLVHISSHFRFQPGDASSSFLVLGDNHIWTLADMREDPTLFHGVELLTLSACETAAQRPDANGKEVDAFAELAQRLGAASVMASLWPVLDKSTANLMKAFYDNRQGGRFSKAESLRQAQLDFLYGRNLGAPEMYQTKAIPRTKGHATDEKEDLVEPKYRVPFKIDPQRPLAHPYYWAPFVLFGNWK